MRFAVHLRLGNLEGLGAPVGDRVDGIDDPDALAPVGTEIVTLRTIGRRSDL